MHWRILKSSAIVAEIRKLSMGVNTAQTRNQKAAVKSKLRERCRELTTILRKKGGQDLEKRNSISGSCKE